jgi:hypothetical protein
MEIIKIINTIQFWHGISIIQFVIIIVLLIKLKKKKTKKIENFEEDIIMGGKGNKVDMDELMKSIYKSKSLYDSLIRKVHPNRFAPDEQLMKIADEISAEVGQHKNNYSKLLELEEKAKLVLKIQ